MMNRRQIYNKIVRLCVALLFAACLCGANRAVAESGLASYLTVAYVKASQLSMEADDSLDETAKAVLRPTYQQAIEAVKRAADYAARAAAYNAAIKTAPGETDELQNELKALPSREKTVHSISRGSMRELQEEVFSQKASLAAQKNELNVITDNLSGVLDRPAKIMTRLRHAQSELADVRSTLVNARLEINRSSPEHQANLVLLEASEAELLGEINMLQQEQLSQDVREELSRAKKNLLERRIENTEKTIEELETMMARRLSDETADLKLQADAALKQLDTADPAVQELAAEIQDLIVEFGKVTEQLTEVSALHRSIAKEHERLGEEYDSLKERMRLSRTQKVMGQILFNLRSRLPSHSGQTQQMHALLTMSDEASLAAFDVEEKIQEQEVVELKFADETSPAARKLISARAELLMSLRTQYAYLIRVLAMLENDQQQHFERVHEVAEFVREQLFWAKSASPVSGETLAALPSSFKWFFARSHFHELRNAVRDLAARYPLPTVLGGFFGAGLLVMRRRIKAELEHTGRKIRRISSDRYHYTARALLLTIFLSLPVPLLLFYAYAALGAVQDPGPWVRGIAHGFMRSAQFTLGYLFLINMCRRGGVFKEHFGWPEELVDRCRSVLFLFTLAYVPALLLISSSLYHQDAPIFDSMGRSCFILLEVWEAVLVWKFLNPSTGILAPYMQKHPTSLLARLRYVWYTLLIGFPITLIVLVCYGYLLSAIEFSLTLMDSLGIAIGGVILYWLALRWFMIRERKLALVKLLEVRRSQRVPVEEPKSESGEVIAVDIEEDELDLDLVGAQTRGLLGLLFTMGTAFVIGWLWVDTIPIVSTLSAIYPFGGRSLLQISQALLVVLVTYRVAQDLPGLLELAVFRITSLEAGRRSAFATLCQYAVVAIGLMLLFGILEMDWAKFGWIVAALSVGLGFGLQEVVANFVCGLIVLFECPVRVGDVVTLEGTTGTVTRIHLRATTIMNWDRQEFIVPNKSLITGSLLNWTLSTGMNRVIVTVGVAYGIEAEKVRRILLDVASGHPRILKDPPPQATFEEFADSSLTFRLRAYLPEVENRLGVVTELNTEIQKRFNKEGIEIAFPQRDLHLRTGWEIRPEKT